MSSCHLLCRCDIKHNNNLYLHSLLRLFTLYLLPENPCSLCWGLTKLWKSKTTPASLHWCIEFSTADYDTKRKTSKRVNQRVLIQHSLTKDLLAKKSKYKRHSCTQLWPLAELIKAELLYYWCLAINEAYTCPFCNLPALRWLHKFYTLIQEVLWIAMAALYFLVLLSGGSNIDQHCIRTACRPQSSEFNLWCFRSSTNECQISSDNKYISIFERL